MRGGDEGGFRFARGWDTESSIFHEIALSDFNPEHEFIPRSKVATPDTTSFCRHHFYETTRIVRESVVQGVGKVHPTVHVALDAEIVD